jgi:hypothetical protein
MLVDAILALSPLAIAGIIATFVLGGSVKGALGGLDMLRRAAF